MTNYLLAGGGTAGHVNPLLALADEILSTSKNSNVYALGTIEGLESKLVPERGYKLLTVPRLPMPRKINSYALKFPILFRRSVRQVKGYLRQYQIDVVVGFGGYASAPAYRAAKSLSIPYVIHEANALPGYANKVGAKSASAVAVTFSNTDLPNAILTGMPIRKEILFAKSLRNEAAKFFDLDPNLTTVLVTGGSLGARSINQTIELAREDFSLAGFQLIHIVGERAGLEDLRQDNYLRLKYCQRMELALAMADFAISRAGAATVSELSALAIPSALIPYPVGNGEQALNAQDLKRVGAALVVEDKHFNRDYVKNELIPLISDSQRLAQMSNAARGLEVTNGAAKLLALTNSVLGK